MQKNVETVLVVVLLELRVGDEFGHEEVCGRREKGGRDGGHWVGTTGVIGNKWERGYMSRPVSHVASRIMPRRARVLTRSKDDLAGQPLTFRCKWRVLAQPRTYHRRVDSHEHLDP